MTEDSRIAVVALVLALAPVALCNGELDSTGGIPGGGVVASEWAEPASALED